MFNDIIDELISAGDFIFDPLAGEIREIDHVVGGTVYLTDGGVMGADECNDVILPSEYTC